MDLTWEPRRRLRHLRHLGTHLSPPAQRGHVLTVLLVTAANNPSHPPHELYCKTLEADDPCPEFPEINFPHQSTGHLLESSVFRFLLLSHAESTPDNRQPCSLSTPTTAPTTGQKQSLATSACQACMQPAGNNPPDPAASCRGAKCSVAQPGSCFQHLPFVWHREPASDQLTRHDNVYGWDSAADKGSGMLSSVYGSRHPSSLPTIRESRSFRMSLSSSLGADAFPGADRANSSSKFDQQESAGTVSELLEPVLVSFKVTEHPWSPVHVSVTPQTPPAAQPTPELAARNSGGSWASAAPQSVATSINEDMVSCFRDPVTSPSNSRSCTWRLKPGDVTQASLLMDVTIDLANDVTPVPLKFSRLHNRSALPVNSLLLGLATAGPSGGEGGMLWTNLQHCSLFVYPRLTDAVLKKFVEDNRRNRQVWKPVQPRPEPHHSSGIVDFLRNAIFPFHNHHRPAKPTAAHVIQRTSSSPAFQKLVSSGSLPCLPAAVATAPSSRRGAPSATQPVNHRRTNTQTSAPGLAGSVATGSDATERNARSQHLSRPSGPVSVSSASSVGSETQSDSVALLAAATRLGTRNGAATCIPAMQYCAFVIPAIAEQVKAQRKAEARVQELRRKVQEAVQASQEQLEMEARLRKLQARTQQMRAWSDGLARKTLATKRAIVARRQRLHAREQQLHRACGEEGPLAAGLKRAKDLRLCYPDMMYSLRQTHGLLVTRRHSLVISLFKHFQLQPMALKAYTDGVLSEMQDLWMHRRWHEPTERRTGRAMLPSVSFTSPMTLSNPRGTPRHSRSRARGSPAGSPSRQPQAPARHDQGNGITSKLTPVMTIMGLLCTPDMARRAQLGELGLDTSSPVQMEQMNAAFGLICQVVVFLGVVLDTPPLFHIILDGSYCSIQQHIPRFSRVAAVEADAPGEEEGSQHGYSLRLTEQPLHVEQGKHDKLKKFAWACFLLGSNVQLLLHEHDIVPHGQQYLLENLEKLVSAARMSGLQPTL